MTNLPTDKTYCVMLKDGYKTYLTKKQAEFLSQMLEQGKEVVRIPDGQEFKTFLKGGGFILPAGEIEREDRLRRGDYQCQDCNRWIPRGKECGCQGGKY